MFIRSDWLDFVKCNLPSQLSGKAVSYTVCQSSGAIAILVFDLMTLHIALSRCDLQIQVQFIELVARMLKIKKLNKQ